MPVEITKDGRILNLQPGGADTIIKDIFEEIAKSAKIDIITELERSAQLVAYINEAPDPEAMRTLIRGIKVEVDVAQQTITAKFDDEYGHWYNIESLPEETIKGLQEILEQTITKWSESGKIEEIITKIFSE